MSSLSMADVAYEYLQSKSKEVPFAELWKEVSTTLGFSETVAMNKIGSFYESMMLDERFTTKDNNWDLSARHKFDETHVDISAIEVDDSRDDEDGDYIDEDEEIAIEKDSNDEDDVY